MSDENNKKEKKNKKQQPDIGVTIPLMSDKSKKIMKDRTITIKVIASFVVLNFIFILFGNFTIPYATAPQEQGPIEIKELPSDIEMPQYNSLNLFVYNTTGIYVENPTYPYNSNSYFNSVYDGNLIANKYKQDSEDNSDDYYSPLFMPYDGMQETPPQGSILGLWKIPIKENLTINGKIRFTAFLKFEGETVGWIEFSILWEGPEGRAYSNQLTFQHSDAIRRIDLSTQEEVHVVVPKDTTMYFRIRYYLEYEGEYSPVFVDHPNIKMYLLYGKDYPTGMFVPSDYIKENITLKDNTAEKKFDVNITIYSQFGISLLEEIQLDTYENGVLVKNLEIIPITNGENLFEYNTVLTVNYSELKDLKHGQITLKVVDINNNIWTISKGVGDITPLKQSPIFLYLFIGVVIGMLLNFILSYIWFVYYEKRRMRSI